MRPVSGHLALKQADSPWRHLTGTVLGTEIRAGVRHHGVAGHRRLYADAVRQRLHGEQPRHPIERSPHGLSRVRSLHYLYGSADRESERRLWKVPGSLFSGARFSIVMVLVYTHLGHVSLVTVIVVTVLMFVGIFSRMIPSQALISAIPEMTKRGSFNAGQRIGAATLRRHRLGDRRRRRRARPRWQPATLRSIGLYRRRDNAGVARLDVLRSAGGGPVAR